MVIPIIPIASEAVLTESPQNLINLEKRINSDSTVTSITKDFIPAYIDTSKLKQVLGRLDNAQFLDLLQNTGILYEITDHRFSPLMGKEEKGIYSLKENLEPANFSEIVKKGFKPYILKENNGKLEQVTNIDSIRNLKDLENLWIALTIDMKNNGNYSNGSGKNKSWEKDVWHSTTAPMLLRKEYGLIVNDDKKSDFEKKVIEEYVMNFKDYGLKEDWIKLSWNKDNSLKDVYLDTKGNEIPSSLKNFLEIREDKNASSESKNYYHLIIPENFSWNTKLSAVKGMLDNVNIADVVKNPNLFKEILKVITPSKEIITKTITKRIEKPKEIEVGGIHAGLGFSYDSQDKGILNGKISLGYLFNNGIDVELTGIIAPQSTIDVVKVVYGNKWNSGTREEVFERLTSIGAEFTMRYKLNNWLMAGLSYANKPVVRLYKNNTSETSYDNFGLPVKSKNLNSVIEGKSSENSLGINFLITPTDKFGISMGLNYITTTQPKIINASSNNNPRSYSNGDDLPTSPNKKFKKNYLGVGASIHYMFGHFKGNKTIRNNLPSGVRK